MKLPTPVAGTAGVQVPGLAVKVWFAAATPEIVGKGASKVPWTTFSVALLATSGDSKPVLDPVTVTVIALFRSAATNL